MEWHDLRQIIIEKHPLFIANPFFEYAKYLEIFDISFFTQFVKNAENHHRLAKSR